MKSSARQSVLIVVASMVIGGLLTMAVAQLAGLSDGPTTGLNDARTTAEPVRRELPPSLVSSPDSPSADEPEPSNAEPEPPAEARAREGGCGHEPEFVGSGKLRAAGAAFAVYVPETYEPERRHMLLMLFHDDNQDAARFIRVSGFNELADKLGVVLIAPQHPEVIAWPKKGEAVIAKEIVDVAEEEFCIDRSRVYAVGFGAGGRVVEEIPCIMNIAGIATASYRSTVKDVVCEPATPVPYIHMAPLKDRYTPVEGGRGCGGLHEPISLKQKEQMWRERNACNSSRRVFTRDEGTTCYTWECQEPFVSCHVDGGRGWPGTKRRIFDIHRCDGPQTSFPYAATIWRFFAEGVY